MLPVHQRPKDNVSKCYSQSDLKKIKIDIEKKLLQKFGVETSFFFGLTISIKTQLIYPDKREMLLNHLKECHKNLNIPLHAIQKGKLLRETEFVLKKIFSDQSFNNEDFRGMANDLHYLMIYKGETRGTFSTHAKNLITALSKDLSENKVLHLKNKDFNSEIYEGTFYRSDTTPDSWVVTYPGGIKYTGNLKNCVPNGFGKMHYSDSSTYEGDWVNGVPNGFGKMHYSDGSTYEGAWVNGIPNGRGLMKYSTNGWTYDGDFVNGIKNGRGKMTYSDGSTYEGAWVNGNRDGKGTLKFSDESNYMGFWKSNLPKGRGKLSYLQNNKGKSQDSEEWDKGYLPIDKFPVSNLSYLVTKTDEMISQARTQFALIMRISLVQEQCSINIPSQIYPRLDGGNQFAYITAVDPILSIHPKRRQDYGPKMFDGDNNGDPCNHSKSYLDGFFRCAQSLAQIPVNDLNLRNLKSALSKAFPPDYIELNLFGVNNPVHGALKYYEFSNNDFSISNIIRCGLFYQHSLVMPYSEFVNYNFMAISPRFINEESMYEAFDKYKTYFLDKVKQATGDKSLIKAAIILFISQIEGTHFFSNGNNRLSCQILLNKLLVEYKVYDDNLGSILFIPNGFSHYALSHLNYFLQCNDKKLDQCSIKDLANALISAIAWVDFGHECYQKVAQKS